MMTPWLCLAGLWWFARGGLAVDCFTCSVDFRSEKYNPNNTCLFPPKDGRGRSSCNRESKYCQGIITRVNGVFVQIQRTCEAECHEFCTEKGFGIETSECHFCCNDSVKFAPSCGVQGYRSAGHAPTPHHLTPTLALAVAMLVQLHVLPGGRGGRRVHRGVDDESSTETGLLTKALLQFLSCF